MLILPPSGATVWPAAMVVWGPGFSASAHSHHSVQLLMTMSGSLRVRGGPGKVWRRCGAVVVRPDAVHEVDARGGTVLIAFVDPESELGGALGAGMRRDVTCVPARQLARWRAALGSPLSGERVEQWVGAYLLCRRRPATLDPRIARAIAYVRQHLGAPADLSLNALAVVSGLSRSRFMHLFTESLGVPLRPYVLWLRLQRAACDVMHGVPVTTAAHRAGFADAAHLTRTFRRMLGATPSELALRKRLSRGVSVAPSESGHDVPASTHGARRGANARAQRLRVVEAEDLVSLPR
jgi:AraC-like DNA-binding protein